MKKLFSLLLCVVMALSLVACGSGATVEINEANFPDEFFREYVKTEFDKDHSGALTAGEIEAAKQIILQDNSSIATLRGVEYLTGLTYLLCTKCGLTELDVSKNTKLKSLFCSGNQLTALDVSANTELLGLECDGNRLTELKLGSLTALRVMDCTDNQLTELDISACPYMINTYTSGSPLEGDNGYYLEKDNELSFLYVDNTVEILTGEANN